LLKLLTKLAESDPSPVVRLYLASGLQRLPTEKRWEILENLLARAEDAGDHNLPLTYWYAAEPLASENPARALDLAVKAKVPQLLPLMVRRIGSSGTSEAIVLLVDRVAKVDDAAVQLTFLRGIRDALKGNRQVTMPAAWPKAFARLTGSKNAEVRSHALALAVTF